MEHYFFIILAIGAFGQNFDDIKIPVNSAEILENVPGTISDQNTADGHLNLNTLYGNIGPNYGEDNYGNGYNGRYFGNDVKELLNDRKLSVVEKFGKSRGIYEHYEFDDGNPDIHGRIERPCQAYDTFCISKFFSDHPQCKISGRQVPEPLYRAQSALNLPNVNVSAVLENVEYSGIKDGRIEEFYIDKATDNLVISVNFDQVTLAIEDVNLKFYLRGREPIVTQAPAAATFVKVSVTAVIPNLKDLKLDRAEVFTYAEEPIPPFLVEPTLPLSTDPEVITMFAETLTNVATDAKESLLTDGVFYIANYIQYNICDFGLEAI